MERKFQPFYLQLTSPCRWESCKAAAGCCYWNSPRTWAAPMRCTVQIWTCRSDNDISWTTQYWSACNYVYYTHQRNNTIIGLQRDSLRDPSSLKLADEIDIPGGTILRKRRFDNAERLLSAPAQFASAVPASNHWLTFSTIVIFIIVHFYLNAHTTSVKEEAERKCGYP